MPRRIVTISEILSVTYKDPCSEKSITVKNLFVKIPGNKQKEIVKPRLANCTIRGLNCVINQHETYNHSKETERGPC